MFKSWLKPVVTGGGNRSSWRRPQPTPRSPATFSHVPIVMYGKCYINTKIVFFTNIGTIVSITNTKTMRSQVRTGEWRSMGGGTLWCRNLATTWMAGNATWFLGHMQYQEYAQPQTRRLALSRIAVTSHFPFLSWVIHTSGFAENKILLQNGTRSFFFIKKLIKIFIMKIIPNWTFGKRQ